jgi:hypothetical protein
MAARLSPVTLVQAAKIAIADDRDAELARRLADYGLDPINTARSIMRWKNGETQPEYAATLALLDLAGWLDEDAIRRTRGRAEAEAATRTADRARRLAERESSPQRRKRSA